MRARVRGGGGGVAVAAAACSVVVVVAAAAAGRRPLRSVVKAAAVHITHGAPGRKVAVAGLEELLRGGEGEPSSRRPLRQDAPATDTTGPAIERRRSRRLLNQGCVRRSQCHAPAHRLSCCQ